jgi:hypothetical protein
VKLPWHASEHPSQKHSWLGMTWAGPRAHQQPRARARCRVSAAGRGEAMFYPAGFAHHPPLAPRMVACSHTGER